MDVYDYYITPEEYKIAESNGISKELVNKRVRLYAWDKHSAILLAPNKIKKYDESIKALLKVNGISEATFYKRISYGWTVERAATESVNFRKDIINKMINARRRNING